VIDSPMATILSPGFSYRSFGVSAGDGPINDKIKANNFPTALMQQLL
jgi:hypothetical protein